MFGSGVGIGAGRTGIAAAMVAAAAVAAVWLVALMGMPGEADAHPVFKPKIVTKTFHNFSAITINSSTGQVSPYPSPVAAGGFRKGKILDANVKLRGFSHSFPDDVDVLLAHRARNATIMSDVGFSPDASNITLGLDDEAAGRLPDYGPLVGGTFKPTNITTSAPDTSAPETFPGAPAPSGAVVLSTFDRMNPNGLWSLFVADDTAELDGGQFAAGWSLQIKAKVLVPKKHNH